MGYGKYLKAIKREGFSWYESEVPPEVVGEVLGGGERVRCRSYLMGGEVYGRWLEKTGMDMVYGYVPWMWGRENGVDEWGRFVYKRGRLEVGELVERPPYDVLKRRLEEICEIKGERGVEWAIYNTPQVVMDGLGLEKMCWAIKDKPIELRDWMERIDERVSKELETILEWPVEVVQISQPICDKNGPMFGPGDLREYNLKYLHRRAERIHSEGRLVSLHCDGNNRKIMADLRDVDVFNGYDGDGFDSDYKGTVWGWRGTVPTKILESGTPQEVREHVKGMKPQVIGSEDLWEVRVENWVAMMEEARVRT